MNHKINDIPTPNSDRAAVRGFPPLYFILSLMVSLAIHYWVFPLSLNFPATSFAQGSTLRIALGLLISLIAPVILVSTMAQYRRTGNEIDPSSSTASIITSGPNRFSRNPIYLGLALLQTAIAIIVGSVWALASVMVALLLVQYFVILPEEEYLESKFGEEYREYKSAVRRWL